MSKKTLYIFEKPDQGRIVAQARGGGSKTQGGIDGADWVITWGFGHLMSPYMPQDYDASLKAWEWDPLPIIPEKFLFKPKDANATRQIGAIRKMVSKAREIVVATDADREGELIAYEIINEIRWKGPIRRLWISDLTLDAVQSALRNLKPGEETKPLYHAALARTYADWIVGMNMSRAATLKLAPPGSKPFSIGRVQTPVLALIVDLEREIRNFKPQDYFEISANVETASGNLVMRYAPPPEKRVTERKKIEAALERVKEAQGPLSAKTEKKTQAPPALMDLNALQQNANQDFGWSAEKALKVLQALYEEHQIVTYPRTDCRVLPEDHKNNIPTIAGNLDATLDIPEVATVKTSPKIRAATYNDKKVTAHHAIVPTLKKADLSSLSSDESRLYTMICKSWIASHLDDMEYLQTQISMDANGVPLKASGHQITKEGWSSIYRKASASHETGDATENDQDDETAVPDNQKLPPIKDGETGAVRKAWIDSKKTTPPKRFNEKTLLQAMKNIANHVKDEKARKILRETSGIGTPATRANIIETLKAREYIAIKKKQITPTDTAFTVIDAMRSVAPAYSDPVMTSRWEDALEEIARGSQSDLHIRFVKGIAKIVREDVGRLRDSGLQRAQPSQKQKSASKKPRKPTKVSGTELKVPFEQREEAKKLGARWDGTRKSWVLPDGGDIKPFKDKGWA